jgi:menaquinol-cytochrome c reductase iron-sulfur subunit
MADMCPIATSRGQQAEVPRRKLLGWLVGLINAGIAAVVAGPTIGFVLGPLWAKRAPGRWVPVLSAQDLAEGQTRSVMYQSNTRDGYMDSSLKAMVYLHRSGNDVEAINPICTHLGCLTRFQEARQEYVCPCHGGVYDVHGRRVAGPPPRNLAHVETKTEAGMIWIHEA